MTEATAESVADVKVEAVKEKATAPKKRSTSRRKPAKQLDRSALNTAVMQTLSKANIDATTTGKISSVVMKHASVENNKTLIYREIIRNHGQKDGLMMYNLIKSLL